MSVCRLACKEEIVKVTEELMDRRVGRSVGGSKGLNGLRNSCFPTSAEVTGGRTLNWVVWIFWRTVEQT